MKKTYLYIISLIINTSNPGRHKTEFRILFFRLYWVYFKALKALLTVY